jgi:uncharacterized protein (DUF1919 family)
MGFKEFLKLVSRENLEVKYKWEFLDKYFSSLARLKLKNKNFSIICNNCVAGGIYHKLGMQFTSPTVGLFFFAKDYIEFLENFEVYIKQPLKFKETSKHPSANELMTITGRYPIGVVGDDVEIHFLHYKDAAEANEKWNRRIQRLNFSNLFFIFSDGDGVVAGAGDYDFKEEYLLRFQKLPFQNKLFLSSKPYGGREVVFLREYLSRICVDDVTRNRRYERYMDPIKWLNKEKYLKNGAN